MCIRDRLVEGGKGGGKGLLALIPRRQGDVRQGPAGVAELQRRLGQPAALGVAGGRQPHRPHKGPLQVVGLSLIHI